MTLTVFDDLTMAGVSIWLDNISRAILVDGGLRGHVEHQSVVGVTSNPGIFEAALADGRHYEAQVQQLREAGVDAALAAEQITVRDVRVACDQMLRVWRASTGRDGRVSLEVDPRAASDADAMTSQALRLWHLVNRPNLMVKIPATDAGLDAITRATAQGISVNVTLVFSRDRYAQVAGAYMAGLEMAKDHGHQLTSIHSVAAFFVSRLDVEVDRRLDALGPAPAHLAPGTGDA